MLSSTPVHFTVLINIGLAFIPFALAYYLFKGSRQRGFLWWPLSLVFIAFLPNSAYVLTDIIHFIAAAKSPDISLTYLIMVLVPLYLIYMVVNFEFYVLSIKWAHQYIKQKQWLLLAKVFIPAMHFLCAIGVYLGRFQRLESADIIRHPTIVFTDVSVDLLHVKSALIITALFILYYAFYQLFLYLNEKIMTEWNRDSKENKKPNFT